VANVNLNEEGKSGLQAYSGIVNESYTTTLQWPAAYDVYDEMRRRDPTIRSLWNALVLLAGTADWYVEPGGQEQADLNAAEFLQTCLDDMSHPFEASIEDALTCVLFGWSWQEICYKQRWGGRGKHVSQHDDGRVGWRKFAVRRQSSFHRWDFDDAGGLKALVQRPAPNYEEITLDIEKSLHFVAQRDGGNPEGLALLESLYEPWYYLKNLQIINGIGWQRSFVGLPVFKFKERPDGDDKAQVEAVGKALTVDEKQYVSVPEKVEFSLESAQNSGAESLLNTIKYYRLIMYQTMLADFIDLGSGQTGSWALGTDKSNLFLMTVDALLDRIASPINRFAVPRLFAYNTFPGLTGGLPRVVHTKVEKPALGQLGNWLQQVTGLFHWTPEDEMWLRKRGGMPTVNLQRARPESEEKESSLAEFAEQDDALDQERNEMGDALTDEVESSLKAQRRRVLGAVQGGVHDDDRFWEEEEEQLLQSILPRLTEMLNIMGQAVAEDSRQKYGLDVDWSLTNARALTWVRKHAGKLVTNVTDTTRANVRQAVANWVETGGKLSDLVGSLEPTFGRKRAELIAATEVTRGYSEAAQQSYTQAGLPSVVFAPPTRPNCRCWIVPKLLPSGEWVVVWMTARDRLVSKAPLRTPWGTVKGDKALHGVIVSKGRYTGKKFSDVAAELRAQGE